MSSGPQKNRQYKKEGGVHKKEGRIQASRTSDRTSEAVQARGFYVPFLTAKHDISNALEILITCQHNRLIALSDK